MKAMQFDRYGPPEVLELVDIDDPHPQSGQVRIRVRAAGVNPVDWKIRGGSSRRAIPVSLPSVPGLEAAGVVDEIGTDVEGASAGDEVFGSAITGAAAEYTILDHWAAKPATMPWTEAAGLAMAVETAARGLDLLGQLAGRAIVISGAAGGVGTAAVQLALARQATVIGTASAGHQDYLRSLGAMPTVYGPGLPDRVRALAPGGVDVALDVAGHGVLPDLIAVTGGPDNVVTLIDPDAAAYDVRFTTGGEGRAYYALAVAAGLFTEGRFTMPVADSFPLPDLGEAHRISEAGHVSGKLVIDLSGA
jgi:NADPH:quinone reductase-like Zn-dependent oxidoreductase